MLLPQEQHQHISVSNYREQQAAASQRSSFQPYVNNGGTTVAIPGTDFAIAAGDTRLSLGYSIQTRNATKLCKLTDKCVLVTAGMQADAVTLHKVLRVRLTQYEHQHGKPMSTEAIAQMLSNMLYSRRFFPYYTFNMLAGLDEEGKGAVYGYDAIGSYERTSAGSMGTGQTLIQPLLDNQFAFRQYAVKPAGDMSLTNALSLVKDAFSSAADRDIYTGDSVEIAIIDKDGVRIETMPLRLD